MAGFDIATDAVIPAHMESGSFLHLSGADGLPLYDSEKTPVGVTMRARTSRSVLTLERAYANQRLTMARQNGFTVTAESQEADLTETLVHCTVGWSFDTLDGADFPCTPDNARKLWSDDRFRRWRGEAVQFINTEANFTKA